jgi:uncharacterized repeat protein (TIGR01451 family)
LTKAQYFEFSAWLLGAVVLKFWEFPNSRSRFGTAAWGLLRALSLAHCWATPTKADRSRVAGRAFGARLFAAILAVLVSGYASPAFAAGPNITTSFSPGNISLNGTSSLNFTITNSDAVATLTGVGFTENLPSSVTVASSSTATCGGTLTTTASSGISLSGASIAPSGQCQFSVTVTGTASGSYANVTGFAMSDQGAGGTQGISILNVAGPPGLGSSFSSSSIGVGQTSSLIFTLTNANAGITLTGIGFTDTPPSGVQFQPGTSNVCGGTLTATANSLSLSGATVGANAQCQFSATAIGTTPGIKSNSTSAVTSTEGGSGNVSTTQLTVNIPFPPAITASFSPTSVPSARPLL